MDLDKEPAKECKEKFIPIHCMMLKIKYESLKEINLNTKNNRDNMALNHEVSDSNCYNRDVVDRSFKVLSGCNVESSNVACADDNVDISVKKAVKTKISRLSLKKLLNNTPDTSQSNLNAFLDIQTASKTCNSSNKSKKIEKNDKNISDKDGLEEKVIYKVSNSIFGAVKSRSNLERPKKKNKKCVESIENSLDRQINNVGRNLQSKKINCEVKTITNSVENNLELELIANKPRKCNSLQLKDNTTLTPQKFNLTDDLKSFSARNIIKQSIESKNAFDFLMDKVNSLKKVDLTEDIVSVEQRVDHKGKRKSENNDFTSWKSKRLKKHSGKDKESPGKLRIARRIRIIESDDSSRDSTTCKSTLRRSKRLGKSTEYCIDVASSNDDASNIPSVFTKTLPKPMVDPTVLEAKKLFLNTISPTIKRKHDFLTTCHGDFDPFPQYSHTQQKTDSIFWRLPLINQNIINPMKLENNLNCKMQLGSFTNCNEIVGNKVALRKVGKIRNKNDILIDIKGKYPKFPVDKTYELLKVKHKRAKVNLTADKSNEINPNELNKSESSFFQHSDGEDLINSLWTDKYKPMSSVDIIGNQSAAVALLKFLKCHLLYCNESTTRNKSKTTQYDSDFVSSDDDNLANNRSVANAMLVRGPHGSGKTSSIYAVCRELDINVLELNASSRRTGRLLLQKLQEATQSQQIHQRNSQNAHKLSRKMCILLVEDVDVVFEQDDGFIAALAQLLQTTKRPIILTCTNDTSSIVRKFSRDYPVVTFVQLSAKASSVWLQLVCLLEDLLVGDECLGELLEWNKGDLRRTVLQLQFWARTGGDSDDCVVNPLRMRVLINDFDANKSILHTEQYQHRNVFLSNDRFVKSCSQIWWNFSAILKTHAIFMTDETKNDRNYLKHVQTFYDSLSIADLIRNKYGLSDNDLEPTFATYQNKLKDSLCLENFDDCFTQEKDHFKDITDFLVHTSFNRLIRDGKDTYKFKMSVPEVADRRWRFEQHNCQNTFADKLPINISLDRKSFALDYYPTLISIVKIEQARLKTNGKRKNRYWSYLRCLGLKFTDSQLKCLHSAFVHAK